MDDNNQLIEDIVSSYKNNNMFCVTQETEKAIATAVEKGDSNIAKILEESLSELKNFDTSKFIQMLKKSDYSLTTFDMKLIYRLGKLIECFWDIAYPQGEKLRMKELRFLNIIIYEAYAKRFNEYRDIIDGFWMQWDILQKGGFSLYNSSEKIIHQKYTSTLAKQYIENKKDYYVREKKRISQFISDIGDENTAILLLKRFCTMCDDISQFRFSFSNIDPLIADYSQTLGLF